MNTRHKPLSFGAGRYSIGVVAPMALVKLKTYVREEAIRVSGKRSDHRLEEERHYVRQWLARGLTTRCANSLVACGILTLDDLRAATDHELLLIPQIGAQALRAVCELVGRDVPRGEG